MSSRSFRRILAVSGASVGLALFAYAVRKVGLAEITDGIQRVGWGLIPILALAGLRFALRAECWRLCLAPGPAVLSFPHAFAAFVAGDAVGSVTPLGLLASEPTKVFLTRHRLATRESVASLALENLVYAVSVMVMVGTGLMVVLWIVPAARAWRWPGTAVGLAAVIIAAVVWSRVSVPTRADTPPAGWRGRLAGVLDGVVRFSAAHPARLRRAFALDLAFHALAVVEVYLTLRWLLGDATPTVAQAIAFEALNRVVTVVFKFVPFRVGIDEALSGALAPALALNPAAGVIVAVIRKVRNLSWSAVGLVIVALHPSAGGDDSVQQS